MRGDGFQQSRNAADPRGLSLSASLVLIGLIATSFTLGALWTYQMLTRGSVKSEEVSARPIDAASDAASKDVASRDIASKDAAELQDPDRDAEPAVLPPSVPQHDLPLAASMSTRRDSPVPEVESRQPPASLLPRSTRSTLPALEDAEVLFDVPIGGHVILPVKTGNVIPAYPRVARAARIGGQVVLEAVITTEGRIADIRVADSVPLFDEAAVAAIRQWQYEPGQLNRILVPVPVTINVTFSLY